MFLWKAEIFNEMPIVNLVKIEDVQFTPLKFLPDIDVYLNCHVRANEGSYSLIL